MQLENVVESLMLFFPSLTSLRMLTMYLLRWCNWEPLNETREPINETIGRIGTPGLHIFG